jgi:hypothetical protein
VEHLHNETGTRAAQSCFLALAFEAQLRKLFGPAAEFVLSAWSVAKKTSRREKFQAQGKVGGPPCVRVTMNAKLNRQTLLIVLSAVVTLLVGCNKKESAVSTEPPKAQGLFSANESCEVEASDMCVSFQKQSSKENITLCKGLGGKAVLGGSKCTPLDSLGSCVNAKDAYTAFFRRGEKNSIEDSKTYCEKQMNGQFRARSAQEIFSDWKPLPLTGKFDGVFISVPLAITPEVESEGEVVLNDKKRGFHLRLSPNTFEPKEAKNEAMRSEGFDKVLEEGESGLLWRMKEGGDWKYDFSAPAATGKFTCTTPFFVYDLEFARAMLLACKSATKRP